MKRSFWILMIIFFALHANAQEVLRVKATDVEKIIAESKTPLIVNMWATWCIPCIEELPYFLEEVKEHKKDSVQLILVSLDFKESFPEVIDKFMEKNKIKTTVLWLDETNADYFCPKVDPKWSGAIPATLFINNKKRYRKFIEEQLSHDELKKEIRAIL